MRIAGGVLLLLVGLTSLVEGGCVAMSCHVASKIGAAGADAAKALQNKKNVKPEDIKNLKGLNDLRATGAAMEANAGGLTAATIVIRLGGLLCIVAGILFFVNKAKIFGFIAPAVGIIGEIILFVVLAFNIFGLVKILIYAFGAFAATKVGAES